MSTNPIDPREVMLPRPDVSEINQRGVEFVRQEIAEFCRETVDLVYDGVKAYYLEADALQAQKIHDLDGDEDLPMGEVLGRFVKEDSIFAAPLVEGRRTKTFCTRLEPTGDEDRKKETPVDLDLSAADVTLSAIKARPKRYMKLHVPAEGFELEDFEMPPQRTVDHVYVQTVDGTDIRWFAIHREGYLYEYVPESYQGEDYDSTEYDKRVWAELVKGGFPVAQKTIVRILEHITDWTTVPQSLRVVT